MPAVAHLLVAALLAGSPDPATVLPAGVAVYVEAREPRVLAAAIEARLPPSLRERWASWTAELEALPAGRAAFGWRPSLFGRHAWWLVLEGEPGLPSSRLPAGLRGAARGVVGRFTVLSGRARDLEEASETFALPAESLAMEGWFGSARSATPGADLWAATAPRLAWPLRFAVPEATNPGDAFLAGPLRLALRRIGGATLAVRLGGRLDLELRAGLGAWPELAGFAASTVRRAPAFRTPPGTLLEVHLRRDPAAFWRDRDRLCPPESARGLAGLETGLAILLAHSAEELAESLGPGVDLYVTRLPASPSGAVHELPGAALVLELREPRLAEELVLGFQAAIGIVNVQRAQDGLPRLLLETAEHEGVPIHSARFPESRLRKEGDDRAQLRPSLAVVEGALLLGTHPELLRLLIGLCRDAGASPPGDALRIFGPEASQALARAEPLLRARAVLERGLDEAAAGAEFLTIHEILDAISELRIDLELDPCERCLRLRIGVASGVGR